MAQTAIGVVILGTVVTIEARWELCLCLTDFEFVGNLPIQSDLSGVLKDWRVDSILFTNKFRTFSLLLNATRPTKLLPSSRSTLCSPTA